MTKPPVLPVLLSYGWEDRRWGNGVWQKVRCPFHGTDRNPSASLNEDEQVFKCHTCGIGGDAYAVVMEADGIDFLSAKQRVKEITGHEGTKGGSGNARSKLPLWAQGRNGSAQRRIASGRSRGRR